MLSGEMQQHINLNKISNNGHAFSDNILYIILFYVYSRQIILFPKHIPADFTDHTSTLPLENTHVYRYTHL